MDETWNTGDFRGYLTENSADFQNNKHKRKFMCIQVFDYDESIFIKEIWFKSLREVTSKL